MKRIYVDGSCRHREGKGAWAVITDKKRYSGILQGKNLDGVYCELFAIRQALMIARKYRGKSIIFTDNNAATNLNKSKMDFRRVLKRTSKRKKIKNKSLLSNVYDIYNLYPNIQIRKISRKDNFKADELVRKTLKTKWG